LHTEDELLSEYIREWKAHKPESKPLDNYLKGLFEAHAKTQRGERSVRSLANFFEIAPYQPLVDVYIKTPEIIQDAIACLIDNDKNIVLKFSCPLQLFFCKNNKSIKNDYKALYEKLIEVLKDRNVFDQDDQKLGLEEIVKCWIDNKLEEDVARNLQCFINATIKHVICPDKDMLTTIFNENNHSLLNYLLLQYQQGKLDEKMTITQELLKFLKMACKECFKLEIKQKLADKIIENWLDKRIPDGFKNEVFQFLDRGDAPLPNHSAPLHSPQFFQGTSNCLSAYSASKMLYKYSYNSILYRRPVTLNIPISKFLP
jgi:hypothetical protein